MIHEFRAEITESSEGRFTARIAPYGVPVAYGSKTVEFAAGSIHVPTNTIPLTVDHSPSALDRVGVMERSFSTGEALFADFTLADTGKGKDVRALLKMGALTDISVGVELDEPFKGGVMSGTLNHVSLVDIGRFPSAEVISVHDDKEPLMAETMEEATAPVVAEFDDTEIREQMAEFRAEAIRLAAEVNSLKPDYDRFAEFNQIDVFTALSQKASGRKVANHALADVIGDLGSADASGIVPDTYWAGGLQHLLDRRRPLFNTAGAAPFPASGNNLDVPRVSQGTAVTKRTAEKGEAGSQALQAIVNAFPIGWFSGAVDISMEIISQSDPSVLTVVMNDLLTQYAKATEADATTLIAATATHTGAALTTDTYANLVADIITTSDLIEDAIGVPGDILGVTSAQWIAILSLMDGGDRRQFAMINPQNADGSGSLVTRGIDVGGVFIYRAPEATTALQYSSVSFKAGEKTPMQVANDNVTLMGRDLGVLGATVPVFWPAGIYSYEVV